MTSDFYTWSEFVAEVRELLPMDSQRLGLQDANGKPGYITRLIRLACIDLQKYVRYYRHNHETTYWPDDVLDDGSASRGTCPPGAMLREFWIFNNTTQTRYPCVAFPYNRRFELVNGQAVIPDQQGRIALDETGQTFWAYPKIEGDFVLVVVWDAMSKTNVKTEFKDDEHVPFEEDAAQVVANYVKADISREVDKNPQLRADYLNDYRIGRRDLYLRHKDKTHFK